MSIATRHSDAQETATQNMTGQNDAQTSEASRPEANRLRLEALLAAKAMTQAGNPAIAEQPGQEKWSGQAPAALTFNMADEAVSRLAAFLDELGLAPESPVAIALPNCANAMIAVLACQRAGLTPCLLSLGWPREALTEAIATIGAEAVLTQTRVGDLRPAELFCKVAATFFGLRFVCAFGEPAPDGVIALDPILADTQPPEERPPGCAGIVTFSEAAPRRIPIARESDGLVAGALPLVVAARISETTPILSLLAPDDLAGLTLGPALSLVTGAPLLTHGLFDSAALLEMLDEAGPVHLVAPGWLEPAIRNAGVMTPEALASLILVHRPPVLLAGHTPASVPVIDAVALGETALIAAARDSDGRTTLGLNAPGAAQFGRTPLMMCRLADGTGRIEVRGRGMDSRGLGAFASHSVTTDADGWLTTPFLGERQDGRIVAIRAAQTVA